MRPLTQNNDGDVLRVVMAEKPCFLRAAVTAFATWPAHLLRPGRVVEQMQDTIAVQVIFDSTPFCVGRPGPEQVHANRKILLKRWPGSLSAARSTCRSTDLPDAMWPAARPAARLIAVADRSIAVMLPPASCSQTSDTAMSLRTR
jgi:hypothetical protein